MKVMNTEQGEDRERTGNRHGEVQDKSRKGRRKVSEKRTNNLAYRMADEQEFAILRPDGTLDHYTPRGMVEAGYYDSTDIVRNWLLWSVLTGYLTPIGPCMFRQRTFTEMRVYAPEMFPD